MLRVLVKKQLFEIFKSYFYDAKKNRARSKGATVAYLIFFAVLMVGLCGGIFTLVSLGLCVSMVSVGMDWLYFAIMGLMAVFLGAFGSVFNTYAGLYLAKDNDLLLSMPIPVRVIMTSRLLAVYLMGLMYSGVVMIPAVAVYLIFAPLTVSAVIGALLSVFLISVFVLTLSAALGWVVAKISLKLKNKSFITVIVSLVFIAAYYFFYSRAGQIITDLAENAVLYGEKIKGAAYPIYIFGRVGTGDWLAMLIATAVVFALFGLMWWLISRSFIRIVTSSGPVAKRRYVEGTLRRGSVDAALLKKEFSRFTSSPNYMLNCGMGVLMLPVLGVLMLIKGNDLAAMMGQNLAWLPDVTNIIFIAAVCTVASMNNMVAPSVSLEGKSLWLVQSLPVVPWQVLRAKISVQLLLTGIPALFATVCVAIVCRMTALQILLSVLTVGLYVLLVALFDSFLGLRMPNLAWTSEITPIKQGMAVTVSVFGGFLCTIVFVGLYFALGRWLGSTVYLLIVDALAAVLAVLLAIWHKTKGAAIFASL